MEKPDFVRYNHDSGVDVRPSLTSKVTITPAKYKIPEQQRVDRTVAGSSKRSTLRFYQLTEIWTCPHRPISQVDQKPPKRQMRMVLIPMPVLEPPPEELSGMEDVAKGDMGEGQEGSGQVEEPVENPRPLRGSAV